MAPSMRAGAHGPASYAEGVSRLHLALPAQVRLERVPDVLGGVEAPWLGEPVEPTDPPDPSGSLRRFACDMELAVGDMGPVLFRKSALVGLGQPLAHGAGWRIPVEWRAATFKPLFPVFAGVLVVEPGRVTLDGHYAPPGGRLAAVLDAVLLNIAARGTARWFLRTVAAALAG